MCVWVCSGGGGEQDPLLVNELYSIWNKKSLDIDTRWIWIQNNKEKRKKEKKEIKVLDLSVYT